MEPGRYRSRYRTNLAWFDLDRKIETKKSHIHDVMAQMDILATLANPDYYESIEYYVLRDETFLLTVKSIIPDWDVIRRDVWFVCNDKSKHSPPVIQGWKIHVSSLVSNAAKTLEAVVPIMRQHGVSFKFALDRHILSLMNSKSWARRGAGKFITIYPANEVEFALIIDKIYQATTQFNGPYILSDKRYKDSKVVYYRYGGITPVVTIDEQGEKVYLLMSPDGNALPDVRAPYFYLPPWVNDPFNRGAEGVSESVKPTNEIQLNNGRFIVKNALGFSNSGGVYLARDTFTDQTVVIKEARPFVMFTETEDAVMLLKKEFRILSKISHLNIAPRPIDLFQDCEHYYLAQEHIVGSTLSSYAAQNSITIFVNPTVSQAEIYYQKYKAIFIQLVNIIRMLHEQRIIYGDLSPNNIIIASEGTSVKLIDFESAHELGIDTPVPLYTPGFADKNGLSGAKSTYESDYYSIGAVMHFMLSATNEFYDLHPEARNNFITSIIDEYGLPRSIYTLIISLTDKDVGKRPKPHDVLIKLQNTEEINKPDLKRCVDLNNDIYNDTIDKILTYIIHSADYNRKDRLFPAYIKVFTTNPLSVAYGACGVISVLNKIRKDVPERMIEWITDQKISENTYPPGLYLGLSGIAWTMLELGITDKASNILRMADRHPLLHKTHDVFYGAAGWGMTKLKFYQVTGDDGYLRQAEEAGDQLIRSSYADEQGYYWVHQGSTNLGYAHGGAGVALFFLYLHSANGQEKYLDAGVKALEYELSNAMDNKDDGYTWKKAVNGKDIVYPYWQYGSAGLGAVLLRYYRVMGDRRYKDILDKIFLDTNRKYTVFPGFLTGLSGLGEFLLDVYRYIGDTGYLEAAYRVADGIMLFKIEKEPGIAFPGNGLQKICCDYGTGSAGIAHYLHRLVSGDTSSYMLDQ